MGIYQRIMEMVDLKTSGSMTRFEAECHIGGSLLRKKKDDVTLRTIDKILDRYKDVSRDWLMNGNGEMLIKDNPVTTHQDKESVYKMNEHDLINYIESILKKLDKFEASIDWFKDQVRWQNKRIENLMKMNPKKRESFSRDTTD